MWMSFGDHFSDCHTNVALLEISLSMPLCELFQFSHLLLGQHTLRTVIPQNCSVLENWPQSTSFLVTPLSPVQSVFWPQRHGCLNPQFLLIFQPSSHVSSFLLSLDTPGDWKPSTFLFTCGVSEHYSRKMSLEPGFMRLLTCLAYSAELLWKETQRTTQIPLSNFGTPASTPSTTFPFLCPLFSVCWIFFLRSHSVDVLHRNLLEHLWKEIPKFHLRSSDQNLWGRV